jgi:DNA-binding NarL/FixJ family response regulator
VVLYSTTIDDNTRKQALATGAIGCIQKPGTIDALAEKLEDLFVAR